MAFVPHARSGCDRTFEAVAGAGLIDVLDVRRTGAVCAGRPGQAVPSRRPWSCPHSRSNASSLRRATFRANFG